MSRRRLWLCTGVAAAGAAGALALALCLTRIPGDSLGLAVTLGEPSADLLGPGAHLHSPLTRVVILPSGRRVHEGRVTATSREGAAVQWHFTVELDLAGADPRQLGRLAAPILAGSDLGAALAGAVEQAVREAGDPRAAIVVEAKLAGLGLVAGSLRMEAMGPVAARFDNPLRDAYAGPRWPILVIGIDSADWDLMNPLLEAGELPHLRALRDRGAWGILHSMSPTLSPILWTTMATGRPPEEHGVMDFLVRDATTGEEVPISRLYRRVKAIWNIATDMDIPSLTVGWWATWPAEPVKGQMVTDRVAYTLFDLPSQDAPQGLTYPMGVAQRLGDLRVPEESVSYEDLRAIVSLSPESFERARSALDGPEGFSNPVSHLIKILASTMTYHRIALDLMARHRPGLSLVYFEGLDEVNHRFAHYLPPTMRLVKDSDPSLLAAFRDAVPSFYRLQDRLVGELVQAAGPEAIVMVVSDHGFANGTERPEEIPPDIEGKPGRWHTMDGALIVAGPPIRPGALQRSAELLDVTPTLLALLGLPAAEDMPGRMIEGIVREGQLPHAPAVAVASYDRIGEPLQTASAGASSATDPEMIAKLKALGYVEPGSGAGAGGTVANATYHINAGQVFLRKNDLDRALQEFTRARELAPRFDQALLGLAQVHVMKGRLDEAIDLLREVIETQKEPQPGLLTRVARIYAKAGRHEDGLRVMESVRYGGRREGYRLAAIGILQQSAGRTRDAVAAYRGALEADPSVEPALRGAYFLLRRDSPEELASLLERSLGVEPARVAVRAANWLALTRESQGRRADARAILARALERSPQDLMTLTNLGSMLVKDGLVAEGLPHLESAYRLQPASVEVAANLIMAYGKTGQLAQARSVFNERSPAARREESRHLENAIAYACFLNGANEEASDHIERSLRLDPNQEEAVRLRQDIAKSSSLYN